MQPRRALAAVFESGTWATLPYTNEVGALGSAASFPGSNRQQSNIAE